MREDVDCEDFLEFCRQFGDDIATCILEDICCEEDSRRWPYRLLGIRGESHDREGNNRTITGTLHYKARQWFFEVRSGNWNGTEVINWERCYQTPCREPPTQSAWLFANAGAIAVRMIVTGERQKLLKRLHEFMEPIWIKQGLRKPNEAAASESREGR